LEGGDSCVAFSSGMAAIACLFELFAPGDRIVTSWDLYGGTIRLFDAVSRKNGYTIDSVDTSDLDRHVAPRSRRRRAPALFVETPHQPHDGRVRHRRPRRSGPQGRRPPSRWTTPSSRPTSRSRSCCSAPTSWCTCGHQVPRRPQRRARRLPRVRDAPTLSEQLRYAFDDHARRRRCRAFDAWLVTRGLKTLPLRMERHQQQRARRSRAWLARRSPRVAYVNCIPASPDHPGHDLCLAPGHRLRRHAHLRRRHARSARSHVLASVKVAVFAESLGGTETLITYPAVQTHADLSEEERQAKGIDACMLRISVGLEDTDDLIADFAQALEGC
jgi:cystathionine gamma-synthase